MIEATPIPRLRLALALIAGLSLAASLSSCLFDKPEEKVELSLSKVPAGADRIKVVAVDRLDTSKIIDVVFEGAFSPGKKLAFSLDKASGKDWLLRVEGYQGDYLVYRSLIPSGRSGTDSASHQAVNGSWPAVRFTEVQRIGDSVRLATEFRSVPDGVHWHINRGADSVGGRDYTPVTGREFTLSAGAIDPGSLLTADLHLEDHSLFPVQEPDTLLGDEVLAPAGSEVQIIEAFRKGDSVHFILAYKNFRMPLVDEPKPGQGYPMLHEAGSLRLIPDFKIKAGDDITLLTGPARALSESMTLVVALHYADRMRIRPAVADTVAAATALKPRVVAPVLKILSHSIQGDVLTLVMEQTNFDGFHTHIYREKIQWPGSTAYQRCHTLTCEVGGLIWQGATKVIVSAQDDATHDLFLPVVSDTLYLP